MKMDDSLAADTPAQIPSGHLAGRLSDFDDGKLLTKIGTLPVLVVHADGELFAIEDRCPHLGFPLHQGTIESGMVTCHWHHARFDLVSGCTLDPWADDAIGFDVALHGDEVRVNVRPRAAGASPHDARLRTGIEQQLTIVIAKATLTLLETPDGTERALRTIFEHGLRNDGRGWGAGLTTATCLARTLDALEPSDRAHAVIHAAVSVSNDAANRAPRFELGALPALGQPTARLLEWYRRFAETRASDGAERALATAVDAARLSGDASAVERTLFATVTDHMFMDTGHTLDFTNKAIEALPMMPSELHATALTSLVWQTCNAPRSEELSEWNHPVDLATLAAEHSTAFADAVRHAVGASDAALVALAEQIVDADPHTLGDVFIRSGATLEQAARAVALAAALRMARFHTSNDVADWNTVHHTMSFANAVHAAVARNPTPELARGVVHAALRVHLDRFLNVPTARLSFDDSASFESLEVCWNEQGNVDRAGSLVMSLCQLGHVDAAIAALGAALLREDGQFHLYQAYEAAVTQSKAWPKDSPAIGILLAGFARFLAAYTPTRRELATIIRTASRLRRGEDLTAE